MDLRKIDEENLWDILELEVFPEQEEFVLSNAVSLAQAYVQRELEPLAIYEEETPVGFLMYCIDRDDGEYWIYRLMIDKNHQKKGYGRAALRLLLERLEGDSGHRRVYLGTHAADAAAIALYTSEGFAFDGRQFGQEKILVRNW